MLRSILQGATVEVGMCSVIFIGILWLMAHGMHERCTHPNDECNSLTAHPFRQPVLFVQHIGTKQILPKANADGIDKVK
uniref:Secreted protein n=1 Tax=Setaria digitata TaxID=48799 RepID=A0A915PRP4_9BILA